MTYEAVAEWIFQASFLLRNYLGYFYYCGVPLSITIVLFFVLFCFFNEFPFPFFVLFYFCFFFNLDKQKNKQ